MSFKIKKINPLLIMLFAEVVLISAAAIIFKQPFFRVLPLYVSLVIYFLQSRINRFAPLVGAINSILYTGVYLYFKLYVSAASAFFYSFPSQIIIFIKWCKNPYGSSTVLKKMTKKQKLITLLSFVVSWLALSIVLSFTDSNQALLDNTSSLLGIFVGVLMFLSFSEYTSLNVVSMLSCIALRIALIVQGNYEFVTYLIFDIFAMVCTMKSVFSAKKLVEEQTKEVAK